MDNFLDSLDFTELQNLALSSPRKRHASILHQKGADFNKVINCILKDSYMQPHCHPGCEKIEHITLLKGSATVIFFDENGSITHSELLSEKNKTVIIPAFSWHTYVMNSDHVITYETMLGIYKPTTWKNLAHWAPNEQSSEAATYLNDLRERCA